MERLRFFPHGRNGNVNLYIIDFGRAMITPPNTVPLTYL